MNPHIRSILSAVAFASAACVPQLHAQSAPTATRTLRISAFAGANGTFTGLSGGRNAGVTAGADLSIRPYFSLEPSLEVRGTYPVHDGTIDAQKNILGGLKVAKRFGPFHPYGDILFGRGEIDYQNGGYSDLSGLFRYIKTVSGVIAPGAGIDLDVSPHFSLKADASFPRYATPVTSSGHLFGTSVTGGLVYHFNIGSFPNSRR